MMRSLWLLTAIIVFQNSLSALDVSVTTAGFKASGQNFLEVYLQVVGSSTTFDTLTSGEIQALVEASIIIEKGDSIYSAERFMLRSPKFTRINDFVELRRYVLPNGTYTLKASFSDGFDMENQLEVIQDINLNLKEDQLEQSDIRLLSSIKKEEGSTDFHRNGYFLEPLPFDYYHRYNSTLIFYNEIYNSDEYIGEDFMITYTVKRKLNAETYEDVEFRHQRMKPQPVNVVLARMDISALPSGNYELEVEVKDREQNVLHKVSRQFARSNPMADVRIFSAREEETFKWLDTFSEDRVEYSMKAMEPILAGQDVVTLNYLLDKGELPYKKNFIYHIFDARYGKLAEEGFHQYMEVATAIDKMFRSGMGYGFETDRGRIYLKYGRPDERIRVEDDQGAFPYEIWYFNRLAETGQTDVRFMFFNPELATNHFILLTSTCRGERQNPRWELQLYRNSGTTATDNRIDATRVQDTYRRRARELYEN